MQTDLLDDGLARRLHLRTAGRGDWTIPDEELHRFHNDQVRELGGHLLGRRLYEVMSYWETAEERNPAGPQYALEFARIWKDLPKIVYSNTLTRVEGICTRSHHRRHH